VYLCVSLCFSNQAELFNLSVETIDNFGTMYKHSIVDPGTKKALTEPPAYKVA